MLISTLRCKPKVIPKLVNSSIAVNELHAKAGLIQLGRIAALELAPKGIRMNMLHPDAVYDTAFWTEETL